MATVFLCPRPSSPYSPCPRSSRQLFGGHLHAAQKHPLTARQPTSIVLIYHYYQELQSDYASLETRNRELQVTMAPTLRCLSGAPRIACAPNPYHSTVQHISKAQSSSPVHPLCTVQIPCHASRACMQDQSSDASCRMQFGPGQTAFAGRGRGGGEGGV